MSIGGDPDIESRVSSAPSSVNVSRPFVVPPLRREACIPVVAGHKDDRELSPKAISTRRQHPKANSGPRATTTRATTTPAVKAAKAESDTSQRVTPDRNSIRILGKNGDEAFVSLPSLPKSMHASSHRIPLQSEVAVSISGSRRSARDFDAQETLTALEAVDDGKRDQAQKQKQSKKQKNKQKQQHKREEQLIVESPNVERGGPQRSASLFMSGALPAPSRDPSQAPQSDANSCRDSGIAMSDFISNSKRASSRASSARSASTISLGVLSIAQQIANIPSTTSTARNSKTKSATPNLEGFKEMGLGMTTGFPTQARTSERGRAKQPASSQHSSQPSVRRDVSSVRQQDDGGMQETTRSNYKPPTVVSAASSESITHSFGGTFQEGFVPQSQYQPSPLRQERETGSRDRGLDQSRSVKDGSVRSRGNDGSDVARSRQGQSNSDRPMSVRSNRGSSVQSSASYASGVASSRQRQTGSQAHRSDQSRSVRRERGSSVQSGVSYASGNAGSQQRQPGSRATSVARTRSDRRSQASGPQCPSHSPVSPLGPSPRLFTPFRDQTQFAGGGWISPHPLSPIDAAATPQPAVHVSADTPGRSGTLTYKEWKAHRDALGSDAGSYAGSHVPSAVGLQPVPTVAYDHPPPASYVGSHNPVTRPSHQHPPQMDGEPAWVSQYFSPLQGPSEMQPSIFAQNQKSSSGSRTSARSQSGSTSTVHNNSVYHQPGHPTSSAPPQIAGVGFPPQDDDRPTSSHASAYNVGLTPTELSTYQSQLGNTISRYSSQLSHVQREQVSSQPSYEACDNGQSHSSRRSPSQHSIQNFPPNLSYSRVKPQLTMPWDPTVTPLNSRSPAPRQHLSSQAGSSWRGRHTPSVRGVGGVESRLQSSASSSRSSIRSRSSLDPAESHVTYGTAEWQNLENAEEGRGGFRDPWSYNMW